MKSALVCALIGSLAAPSISFAGQEPTTTWPKARGWQPGAEVTWMTSHSGPNLRYLIRADDEGVPRGPGRRRGDSRTTLRIP